MYVGTKSAVLDAVERRCQLGTGCTRDGTRRDTASLPFPSPIRVPSDLSRTCTTLFFHSCISSGHTKITIMEAGGLANLPFIIIQSQQLDKYFMDMVSFIFIFLYFSLVSISSCIELFANHPLHSM